MEETKKPRQERMILSYAKRERIFELWGTMTAREVLEEVGIPQEKKQAIYSMVSKARKRKPIRHGLSFTRG